ncbi:MAG TPA: hypothetical protein EYO31_04960 [Phycisphaerales bacterium]|nr:hypothetical protein [Phycisphaerales bacterium]
MSSIAGILRRDGRPIPKKWETMLEEALAIRSNKGARRFEDNIEIGVGALHILILTTAEISKTEGIRVVDGEVDGECAMATWNQETLELAVLRRGIGQKPLYMLDLGEAGDGVVFCSIPTPLTKIASELGLSNTQLCSGVQQYLQLGFVTGGHSLLSPVKTVPIIHESKTQHCKLVPSTIETSKSPADDLLSLLAQLGQPFADTTLLSKVWMYRAARVNGEQWCDGIPDNAQRLAKTLKLSRWKQMLSQFPKQAQAKDWSKFGIASVDSVFDFAMIERLTGQRYETHFCPMFDGSIEQQLASYDKTVRVPDAIARGMDAAAAIARIEMSIDVSQASHELNSYPLSLWFESSQSTLGQLAGDTLLSANAFSDLPIDSELVKSMFDSHQDGSADHAEQLFALLTLALWRKQALA